MKIIRLAFFSLGILFFAQVVKSQDSVAFAWNVTSKKTGDGIYELSFKTKPTNAWQLYAPNQDISGVSSVEITFADTSIKAEKKIKESGNAITISNKLFDNA